MLTLEKVGFRTKSSDKERHFNIMKGLIYQEDFTILNVWVRK